MGVSLTINTIQRGDVVSSVERNDSNFPDLPTKITYKIHNAAFSFTEEVDLTYTSSGDPIFKGITYFGHAVNIFKGTLEAGTKISGSSQKVTEYEIFNGVPTTGTKTDSINVALLDNVAIVVELTTGSPTTTATATPEWSIDNTRWLPLLENTLTIGPSNPLDGFILNQVPFAFLRISFDLILSGGDTFLVDAQAKGLS